jgi:hypothetical protein
MFVYSSAKIKQPARRYQPISLAIDSKDGFAQTGYRAISPYSACDDGAVFLPRVTLVLVCVVLGFSACGSDGDSSGGSQNEDATSETTVPGGGDPGAVRVIDEWANALRAGDLDKAASYFELPSTAQNGTPPLQLRTKDEVVAFNESLPCGAELTRAEPQGEFLVATFELTERPGPGECGPGVGGTARTAFVIEDGKITEWRRAVDEPGSAEPQQTGPIA